MNAASWVVLGGAIWMVLILLIVAFVHGATKLNGKDDRP